MAVARGGKEGSLHNASAVSVWGEMRRFWRWTAGTAAEQCVGHSGLPKLTLTVLTKARFMPCVFYYSRQLKGGADSFQGRPVREPSEEGKGIPTKGIMQAKLRGTSYVQGSWAIKEAIRVTEVRARVPAGRPRSLDFILKARGSRC